MPLNASIFGNMLAAPKSPEDYLAERQNLQAGQVANLLNKQKADEYTKGIERQGQLRNLLAGGADANALRRGGFLAEASDLEKNAADVGLKQAQATKYGADAQQAQLKAAGERLGLIYNAASGARDQQSYTMALQGLQSAGVDVSGIPQQFDPAYVENAKSQALTQMQRLEQAMKQQEFGLKKDQFGETVRHNKSAEGIQVRGQNMADARARDGNTLKAAEIQAGGKPPPGYRWNSDGTLEAIPGGPGDKLPESQQKQVVGTQNLSNAIREYRDSLRSFGILDALKPDQRAMMGTKYNNMMLQAKEAYNLGVLNGPDFDILQSVVTDPRSLKGAITSNKALDTQASELDRIMSGVAQTSSQLKPRGSGSPSSQAPTSGPKPGAVEDGHRFKGGDPSKPSNWEKVK